MGQRQDSAPVVLSVTYVVGLGYHHRWRLDAALAHDCRGPKVGEAP